MLCTLIRLARQAQRIIARTARALIDAAACRLRDLWQTHLNRVGGNAGYAAATAAVLAGGLGLLPARDVIAAVLAAAFGVYLRDSRTAGGAVPRSAFDLD